MEQAAYDREFETLVAPLRYEFSVIEASYDPRVVAMATKYFNGDTSVNYIDVLDVAAEYRIHRDDVRDWAQHRTMERVLEDLQYAAA